MVVVKKVGATGEVYIIFEDEFHIFDWEFIAASPMRNLNL